MSRFHTGHEFITIVPSGLLSREVPPGSPSRGGDVAVYVFDRNQPSLPTLFFICSCVCYSVYGPFNDISFHKFSRQLSAFSLSSSCRISALLVLSTIYLFTKVSFSPDKILCGSLGLTHQLTNKLTNKSHGKFGSLSTALEKVDRSNRRLNEATQSPFWVF